MSKPWIRQGERPAKGDPVVESWAWDGTPETLAEIRGSGNVRRNFRVDVRHDNALILQPLRGSNAMIAFPGNVVGCEAPLPHPVPEAMITSASFFIGTGGAA